MKNIYYASHTIKLNHGIFTEGYLNTPSKKKKKKYDVFIKCKIVTKDKLIYKEINKCIIF